MGGKEGWRGEKRVLRWGEEKVMSGHVGGGAGRATNKSIKKIKALVRQETGWSGEEKPRVI